MSLSAEAEAAELFAAFDSLRTSDWVAFASTAFLIYDYTLTLDREVKLFWTKRFTSVTILYLVIRYSALTYVVLDTLEPAPILTAEPVTLVSRLGLIIADVVLVVLTWRTLGRGPLRPRLPHASRGSLASVMLWNGLLYFMQVALSSCAKYPRHAHLTSSRSALLVLNVLHLSLSLAAVFGTTNGPSNVTLLIDPIMTILVARLMLDLQEANQRDVKLDSGDALHLSQSEGSSSFVRGMGSIRSLVFVDDGEEDSRDGEVQEIGSSHA
ncbi:hypothetical protein K466DRAFT_602353 [Polyporus arcularius HHB13444]|uniref:DUF6533 domain-containing protein n=1 Tax=Polyporus arcularius HHB13444 TaxID=1314778 RepID=A0A5C3P4U3_9APHY|nr:hypothetical protein K466DRAFT_602353 [Polyporus arcularius HHB13444]